MVRAMPGNRLSYNPEEEISPPNCPSFNPWGFAVNGLLFEECRTCTDFHSSSPSWIVGLYRGGAGSTV